MNLGLESTVMKFFAVTDREGGGGAPVCVFGSRKKKEDEKDHGEDAEGSDAKDIFHAKFGVCPISDDWADGAADIDHGVVDGISDGADVFLGSTGGGTDDAGLD